MVFCDLRGFTAFTESAEPEKVMRVLREYHAAVGEIIFQYEGTLDRFAGDGILILFNDPIPFPDHTHRAVRGKLFTENPVAFDKSGMNRGSRFPTATLTRPSLSSIERNARHLQGAARFHRLARVRSFPWSWHSNT